MSILILTTGGTIGALPYRDPLHPPVRCTIPPDRRDLVYEHIQSHYASSYPMRSVCLGLRDSQSIDDDYRKDIVDFLTTAPETKILITHGTDALIQTAGYLYRQATLDYRLSANTILLTGAMVPLANGSMSDGYQNLHFAIDYLSHEKQHHPGINIVLSDFDALNTWKPRLYHFRPNTYRKTYTDDGRYNRLVEVDLDDTGSAAQA